MYQDLIIAPFAFVALFMGIFALFDKNDHYAYGSHFAFFAFVYAIWGYIIVLFYHVQNETATKILSKILIYAFTFCFASAFSYAYKTLWEKTPYAKKFFTCCNILLVITSMNNIFVQVTPYFEHGTIYYTFKQNIAFYIFTSYRYLIVISALSLAIITFRTAAFKREKRTALSIILIALMGGLLLTFDCITQVPLYISVLGMVPILLLFFIVSYSFNLANNKISNLSNYLYSSVSTPILLLSPQGEIFLCNHPTSVFLALPENCIIGQKISCFFESEQIVSPEKFAQKHAEISNRVSTKCIQNNAFCDLDITAIYDRYGDLLCSIFLVNDVSERIETLEQLALSKQAAEQANESKSKFLAKMSHEIRTPMNAIIGLSEILLREDVPLHTKELIMEIKQAGGNLLSIINDILDFSKIESGKLEIISEPYILSSLLNDVISICRIRIMEKPILFTVNIDSHLPNHLIGDEARIRQILLNLLTNAVKYTEQGSISLVISEEYRDQDFVTLSIQIVDTGIGIKEEEITQLFGEFIQADIIKNKKIEGSGLGLAITKSLCLLMGGDITVSSEYEKGSVFHVKISQKIQKGVRFASVRDAQQKQVLIYEPRETYASSILNTIQDLEVSGKIVDNQSQLFEVLSENCYTHLFLSSFLLESVEHTLEQLTLDITIVLLTEYGQKIPNSKYRNISMPAHAIAISNILNEVEQDCLYQDTDTAKIHFIAPETSILIVDDISTNLRVAEGLMLPYQMKIDLCDSGIKAIQLVQEKEYDIIFMDHMMPDMDGIEATLAIRNLPEKSSYFKNLPIIALTANAVTGIKEMFLANGFHDFLPKPIEMKKLNDILEKWIPKEKKEKYYKSSKQAFEEASFSLTGVDIQNGILMTGGTLAIYLKVLSTIYQDSCVKQDEIKNALQTQDILLYTTHVHALKSALASIGAKELSDFAKRLETAGKRGELEFLIQNTPDFLLLLQNLLEELQPILQNYNHTQHPETANVSPELYQYKFEELLTALEEMDSQKIDQLINELRETCPSSLQELLDQIEQGILLFEYEEVSELIKTNLLT